MGTVSDVARYFDDTMQLTTLHCWTSAGGRHELHRPSDLTEYLGKVAATQRHGQSADLAFRIYPGEGYAISIIFPLGKLSSHTHGQDTEVEILGPVREVLVSRNSEVLYREQEIDDPNRFSGFVLQNNFAGLRRALHHLLLTAKPVGDSQEAPNKSSDELPQSA